MSQEIILHHYWSSPFSEKVRLMLGLKGLGWRSVIQPVIMPKPDLVPLTGGYRRIPVMQIGADIFCDSAAILAEIERRHPKPKVIGGADWAVNAFADRQLFQPAVTVIFAGIGDAIDPAFAKDREALSGRPFDATAMKAAAPAAMAQYRAALGFIENALEDGRPFVGGAAASLSDVALYMDVWFFQKALPQSFAGAIAGFSGAKAWAGRMGSIGAGAPTDMSPQEALDIAAAAEPTVSGEVEDNHLGLRRGDLAMVSADDYGRDPIGGRLLALDPRRIVIERQDPSVGRISVSFPRWGYTLAAG